MDEFYELSSYEYDKVIEAVTKQIQVLTVELASGNRKTRLPKPVSSGSGIPSVKDFITASQKLEQNSVQGGRPYISYSKESPGSILNI